MSKLDPEAIAQKLSRMVERIDRLKQLAPSCSFRNVLAHEYDDIDPVQVYSAFQKTLNHYPDYVKAIQMYLDTLEED